MKSPLLARLFIKNYTDTENAAVREKYVVTGGIFGIICNLLLFGVKLFAGILSNSVSITADAFNNLSDTGSSLVSMLGIKLSLKPADRDHPFGHGRIEYMSAFAVSALIIVVGVELLKSSFEKILKPEVVTYTWLSAGILIFSVLIKLMMFKVNRSLGNAIGSAALIATSQDSINDSISTAAVLLGIPVAVFFKTSIDAYIGVAVSAFILYSGFNTAKDALDPLLGSAPDPLLVKNIGGIILSHDDFVGIHDLIVHNYGHGRMFASVHVEVPCTVNIVLCHEKIDLLEKELFEKTGVETVIHMDPIETDNPTLNRVKSEISKILKTIDERLTLHDFRMTPKTDDQTNLIFDIVIPSGIKLTENEIKDTVCMKAKEIDGTYTCVITFDKDYTATF